jgi:hypothetical protein
MRELAQVHGQRLGETFHFTQRVQPQSALYKAQGQRAQIGGMRQQVDRLLAHQPVDLRIKLDARVQRHRRTGLKCAVGLRAPARETAAFEADANRRKLGGQVTAMPIRVAQRARAPEQGSNVSRTTCHGGCGRPGRILGMHLAMLRRHGV